MRTKPSHSIMDFPIFTNIIVMTPKELFKNVTAVEIEVEAIPKTIMSKRYHRHIVLHPSDSMKILLDCPNGTCTERVMVITQYDLQTAIDNALHGDGTFEIREQCKGWEDAKRMRAGMYHCLSDFILKGRVLTVQRTHEV